MSEKTNNPNGFKLDLMQRILNVKKDAKLTSKNYKNLYFERIGGQQDSLKLNRTLDKVWNCRVSANDEAMVVPFAIVNAYLINE